MLGQQEQPLDIRPMGTGRAPYASDPGRSLGRLYDEPSSPTRTDFQRDRDRIVHATAFRRLMHKTQVFVAHEGDHYRTRLTHSLEVAQIARSVGRVLGLDEDLAETLALAHDLGHTPFGHAGEDALNEAMTPHGGFDHNAQTLRILTRLERKYARFDGLNLTWETLEGVVKHNGPLEGPGIAKAVPEPIRDYVAQHDLELASWPGPEAQVAALSDDIAYNNHDLDDGLRAGLFAVDDLAAVPFVSEMFDRVTTEYGEIEPPRLIHEAVRRLIDYMVTDLIDETRRRLAAARPPNAAAVRALGRPVAAFSASLVDNDRRLKDFLHDRMYRHDEVRRTTNRARAVVRELFDTYMEDTDRLPEEWRRRAHGRNSARRARLVADYIAGMTDRFALQEHRRLLQKSI